MANEFEKSLGSTQFYDLSTYGYLGSPILDFSKQPVDTLEADDIIYSALANQPFLSSSKSSESKSDLSITKRLLGVSASKVSPENYLTAIFGNERGKLNSQTSLTGPQGQRATATGTYQITEGTRKGIYNNHFKSAMSYAEFDRRYRTDPRFEKQVALSLADDHIKGSKTAAEALGKWYSPKHVSLGNWNMVPNPEYGNHLSVGQYVNRAGRGLKYEEGGEVMSAKQMLITQCFKKGGKVENFQDQLREKDLPQIETTAVPITLPPNLLYDGTRIANGLSAGISKNKQKQINDNFKKVHELEKKQELTNYKLAKIFHENNPIKKLITGKKPTTAMEPTTKEMMYGAGKGIEEFYKIPKVGIVNDFVNPLHIASSGVIAPWAKAPLEAQQSNSYLPYAGAAASSVLSIPMIMGSKTILQPGVNALKKAVTTLAPMKDAKNLREIVGYYGAGIPFEKSLKRLSKEDLRHSRVVNDLGRMRDKGSQIHEQWQYAMDQGLRDDLFEHLYGKTKTEAKELIANGFGQIPKIKEVINLSRPNRTASVQSIQDALNLRRNVLGNEVANQGSREEVIDELLNNPSILDADAQIRNMGMFNPETQVRLSPLTNAERIEADNIMNHLNEERGRFQDDYFDDEIQRLVSSGRLPQEEVAAFRERANWFANDETGTVVNPFNDYLVYNNPVENEITAYSRNELPTIPSEIHIPESSQLNNYNALSEETLNSIRQNVSRGRTLISADQFRNTETLKQSAIKELKSPETLNKLISSVPYHKGEVQQNLGNLHLSSEGSLKGVKKKVNNSSAITDQSESGKVITGSLNTSHNSYLPQLKQIFKYKNGIPQFLGYQPMNHMGYLSRVDIGEKSIESYLNTEIDELIKKGIVPKNIQRPYLKGDHIMLPHYGIKKFEQGGVISAKQQLISKILQK